MTKELLFELACPNDADNIAQLHALSWKTNYKGIWPDEYLVNESENDRLKVWRKRLIAPPDNQLTIKASRDRKLFGFACFYLNESQKWGSFLDNIHVHPDFTSQGIGLELMKSCTKAIINSKTTNRMYLWVLQDNTRALTFYQKLDGITHKAEPIQIPCGGKSHALRISWNDVSVINSQR